MLLFPVLTSASTSVESYIIAEAQENHISAEKPLFIARCESGLRPEARGDHGLARGIYQIRSDYHPDISDSQADNYKVNIMWAMKYFKVGDYSLWVNCTKSYNVSLLAKHTHMEENKIEEAVVAPVEEKIEVAEVKPEEIAAAPAVEAPASEEVPSPQAE